MLIFLWRMWLWIVKRGSVERPRRENTRSAWHRSQRMERLLWVKLKNALATIFLPSNNKYSLSACVPVKGEIVFTEDVAFNFDEAIPVILPTERAIDRPVDIKRRHPLFGKHRIIILSSALLKKHVFPPFY